MASASSLAADFRVASPETRFSCNFAKLGFHQGFGISVTLPAVVGQQRALELMYTAVDVRGEEALRIGLADRLVSADELRAAAHAFASEIAASAPLAVLAIRETMRGDARRPGARRDRAREPGVQGATHWDALGDIFMRRRPYWLRRQADRLGAGLRRRDRAFENKMVGARARSPPP